MLKTSKKILSIIMVVIMVLTAVPLSSFVGLELPAFDLGIRASALAESGQCGPTATYTFDSSTGELVISGTGEIYDCAFQQCISVKSVTIENGITTIKSYAFRDCSNLTNVIIGDSVTTIKNSAFSNCKNLKNINIPDGVLSIDYHTFEECRSLTRIVIPDSVISIAYEAFINCTSLENITIPDTVTTIGADAFYNTSYYNNYSNWENNVLYINKHLIKANTSISGDYTIKDGTLTIATYAFQNCISLTSLTLGEEIKVIPGASFSNLTGLKTVTLSEGLEKIDVEAFSGCTYLETINIPDSVTYIGSDILKNTAWFNYRGKGLITLDGWVYGYKGAEADITVNFDKTVKGIADSAFRSITNIIAFDVVSSNPNYSSENGVLYNKEKTVLIEYPCGKLDAKYTIPNTVKVINDYAFYNCNNLNSLKIGDSVETIGDYAFYDCNNLSSFEMGDNVITIGAYSFYSCDNLSSLEVIDKVETIGDRAFYACDNLRNITLGKNVKIIGEDAFNCSIKGNYKEVYISDLETWCKIDFANRESNPMYNGYSNYLSDYSSYLYIDSIEANDIIIPDTITEIKDYTFYNCRSIKKIVSPDSVTSIGAYSFYNCDGITNITLPDAVETIGYEAFYGCDNLTQVTLGKKIKLIEEAAFSNALREVFFAGSQEDWNLINKGENYYLSDADLYLMHSHEYTETVIKQVTCEENGEILYSCKLGDTKTEIIPALGHNWVDMGGSIEATCTTDGVNNYKCSNCGEEKKGTTPALGHNWEYIEITYATCDKAGYMSRVCLREGCNVKEEKVTPASHDLNGLVTKDPTCTESGEKYIHCMACSYSFVEIMPVKGHTYSEWVELLPATCNERGLNIKICNDCNDIQRQIIPKLAHIDADGNGVCDTCENTDTPDVPDTPDEPDTPDVPDTPNEPDVPEEPSANCSCNCHKSGLSKIIFNIILFFQKLLRSNKTCICGVSHY